MSFLPHVPCRQAGYLQGGESRAEGYRPSLGASYRALLAGRIHGKGVRSAG